ncbi:SDR family oxidoreductase [Amycolatopsis cihanbeyliensis]|uniref:7-alpha-hydroxysteroid dehydrogenase n=1 Tax=Amycolatopsis cihanbeyliensis TaxID=1128664 RepID=A0A542DR43_AMYCI|nr:SDR family oxidoreductase [Amycolatopsis cihanbeyliensis]TQJ05464.1 7-alpha-hydroxysteroid dehydrogenase [Amycolatopsis cihanbeyliensis]
MIPDRFLLTDRVAVVTGAGRGIGAATALALAEAGADVVIAARTRDQLDEVAARVADAGRTAHVVATDLSDPANAAALADAAVTTFGRLDIVVNNVGGTLPRPLLETSAEFLEEAFRFNVAGAHALISAAAPTMLKSGGGSVVNISSVMGRVTGRGFLAYGTAKAALAHYTRLAAADLAPRVRVNAIAVGSVATSALDVVVRDPDLRERMEAATPLRRIGDPEDVAATIVYLTSPAGSYVTGKVLDVDGGLQAPNLELGLPDLT